LFFHPNDSISKHGFVDREDFPTMQKLGFVPKDVDLPLIRKLEKDMGLNKEDPEMVKLDFKIFSKRDKMEREEKAKEAAVVQQVIKDNALVIEELDKRLSNLKKKKKSKK
jgi:hypothetical protein